MPFGYDLLGRLLSVTDPENHTTSYAYQPAGPIDTITTKNSGGITLESWDYSYNNVHNITQITTTDGNNDYGYDGLNRLTSAIFPPGLGLNDESYTYDQVGNREDPVDPLLYDYDANNRIQSSPGKTYTFDADGNQTATSANETFTYDVINRLRQYNKPGTVAEYDYDPAGRRIRKTVNTTDTTWFLWDGTQLIAEYDGAGNRIQRYAYLPGGYAPSQTEDTNGTYNVHSDHLDTPKLVTNATEVIVWTNHMQAFGESIIDEDPDGDLTAVTLNVRFPGQYEDQDNQLHYNLTRYYSPWIGRYLTEDHAKIEVDVSTYLYVGNSPLNFVDYTGERRIRPPSNKIDSITLPSGTGQMVTVWTGQICSFRAKRMIERAVNELEKKRKETDPLCPLEGALCFKFCISGKYLAPNGTLCASGARITFFNSGSCISRSESPKRNWYQGGTVEYCITGNV